MTGRSALLPTGRSTVVSIRAPSPIRSLTPRTFFPIVRHWPAAETPAPAAGQRCTERTKRMHSGRRRPPAVGMTRELINHPKLLHSPKRGATNALSGGWFQIVIGKPSESGALGHHDHG